MRLQHRASPPRAATIGAVTDAVYQPLDCESLPARLAARPELVERLGPSSTWRVVEVGDGNLNMVFIVRGERGAVVVKQSLPYVRVFGEGWPMSRERAYFEYEAAFRLGARDPGRMPAPFGFDRAQSMAFMELLEPHRILRGQLIAGRRFPKLGEQLGRYCARTAFRGSDWSMPTAERKADLALFAANVELCGISEDLVFTDPFFACPRNRHDPLLDDDVARVRADSALKQAAMVLKQRFCSCAQTLLHGDLHTGSVMATEDDTRVIDAEFAFYGPIGFDIGSLLGNLWMSALARPGHGGDASTIADDIRWTLDVAKAVHAEFVAEFTRLWRTERRGILGGADLFEAQGDADGAEAMLATLLDEIRSDTLGFAGLEMHRRILGFAHVADFETIADDELRARCQRAALAVGREFILHRAEFRDFDRASTSVASAMATAFDPAP
jgi:5-methylthioribose kinase